jgi:hypothetical protein
MNVHSLMPISHDGTDAMRSSSIKRRLPQHVVPMHRNTGDVIASWTCIVADSPFEYSVTHTDETAMTGRILRPYNEQICSRLRNKKLNFRVTSLYLCMYRIVVMVNGCCCFMPQFGI